ncbi:MAG: HlyC/CorC family transporter [Erysipelotrichaceae bacterium]|nr:HlyC/CorC family transporter [Erysipelotrichaceae bacterium]
MDADHLIRYLILLILLMLSAFFSSSETAMISCNAIRMRTLSKEGNKKADQVLKVLENKEKMLSAILIGNNLVNTFAASISATIAYSFGGAAVSIATFLITLLILIFGEITPKTIATQHADELALSIVDIIAFLMVLFTPVIVFVNAFSGLLLKLLGNDTKEKPTLTETELRTIVDVSHEEGVIEKDEKELIHNVFDFGDSKAKDVMVPRVHVCMAEDTSTYQDLVELFRREQFTRIPVYHETIDNVIGLVNMKDLLLYEDLQHFRIEDVLREAYFTYENKPISELMLEMQRSMINMAIVLDEYGELAGVVTLEDIIEEIVGEVRDEYDSHEDANIRQLSGRVFDVKGHLSLHDLNDALHLDLDSEDYDSIGGLVIDRLGHLPEMNDKIYLEDGTRIQVIRLSKNRILEVRISLPKEKKKAEAS